jgi:hypothetical protein
VAKPCPQSTANDWPPEGLSPIEAIVRIVGAERWRTYMGARDTCRGIRPVVTGGRDRSSDERARLERRAAVYEAALGPVLDAWEHGELELWASRGDPTVPPELIQAVARPYMRWQLDRGSFRIEGVVFRNALFRLSWGVKPAAASMRKTKANSRANWLHDAVERRVAAKVIASSSTTRGGSRVPELGLLGSVRGALSNERLYRDLRCAKRKFISLTCRLSSD